MAKACDVCLLEREQCCTCAFCSNRACRDCHIHCDCELVVCNECAVQCPCGARQCEDCVKHCFECDVTFCADCFEAREGVECDECGDGLCRACFEVASDNLGCAAIRGCSGCDTFVCASCCGEEVPIASLGMPVRELPQLAPIAALEAEVLRAFGAREADLAKEEDTEELMHRCTLTLTRTVTLTLTLTLTLILTLTDPKPHSNPPNPNPHPNPQAAHARHGTRLRAPRHAHHSRPGGRGDVGHRAHRCVHAHLRALRRSAGQP